MAAPTRPLKVCGVPEHFNLPWHLAQERGLFDREGLAVEWTDEPCGTGALPILAPTAPPPPTPAAGAMIARLKSGDTDVAVALTEGLVKDIANGSDLKLLGTCVAPLALCSIPPSPHPSAQLRRVAAVLGRVGARLFPRARPQPAAADRRPGRGCVIDRGGPHHLSGIA